jgi:hypothetical protein
VGKPTGAAVAAMAVQIAGLEIEELKTTAVADTTYAYGRVDCQAFVELCVTRCGGAMAYLGSNDMARHVVWMGTLANAKAAGMLIPGAGLLIHEEVSDSTPAKYRGDGLGDFTHVGLYVGENALTDADKNGKKRKCCVVHSGQTLGRVAGGTLGGGWTHAVLFAEIDYGQAVPEGVALGAEVAASDTVKDNPEATADVGDVSRYFTVRRGCAGGAVRRLQTWLNDIRGGDLLMEDGDFGPATEAAARAFQTEQGLKADGVVGKATWRALAAARESAAKGAGGA